jgi:microsomal dipeptidase-like Zn-dependent dipeptidase
MITRVTLLLVTGTVLLGSPESWSNNFVVRHFDQKFNTYPSSATIVMSSQATQFHKSLEVVDLHADSLLWGRDLLRRHTLGHVDLPRLRQGGVLFQVFSIVTHAPRGINIHRNDAKKMDMITVLAMASGWPFKTWSSRLERALYQAARLSEMADRSNGSLHVLRTRRDLSDFRRNRRPGDVAGLLSVEGAQVLEGKIENVDALFAAGVRMMSPTHFIDTELGGSAHGVSHGGLTPFGRAVIARMEDKKMILDLSHASAALIDDALSIIKTPPVVSHTGVRGTCPNERNLSDDQLRQIAARGGLVGIGFWSSAVCGHDMASVARAIRYAVDVMGVKHVALGSDFDGAVAEPIDSTGMPYLTQALQEEKLTNAQIRQIMGGNALRFFSQHLPPP